MRVRETTISLLLRDIFFYFLYSNFIEENMLQGKNLIAVLVENFW
jgi:hypothetical protein